MRRNRGFFLVEIAIALVLLGIIAAAVFPLLNLATRKESDNSDRAALVQARESLLAFATRNGGFPGPLALQLEGTALSRTTTVDGVTAITPAGTASYPVTPYGALPGNQLGTPARSSKGTLFNYDVHPALRSDRPFSFSAIAADPGKGFQDLHAPTNNNQGTGGSVGQLCRNLNTLIEIERLMVLNSASVVDGLRGLTSPRTWQTGAEGSLAWNPATSLFSSSTVNSAWVQNNSSPSAFVVTRPHAKAYARMDRANAVFAWDVPGNGNDRTYRVYEHPSTGAMDSAVDDLRDYGGWSNGASLLELRSALQAAGQCSKPAEACLNTEMSVTFENAMQGQLYNVAGGAGVPVGSPATSIGLPLFWVSNTNAFPTSGGVALPTGGVVQGSVVSSTNAAACVPVVGKDWGAVTTAFGTPLYLHLYAVLPDGKYWEVAYKQLMNATSPGYPVGTGYVANTALDSGKSPNVTLKCFSPSPIRFDTVSGGYSVPDASGSVSCTATNN